MLSLITRFVTLMFVFVAILIYKVMHTWSIEFFSDNYESGFLHGIFMISFAFLLYLIIYSIYIKYSDK